MPGISGRRREARGYRTERIFRLSKTGAAAPVAYYCFPRFFAIRHILMMKDRIPGFPAGQSGSLFILPAGMMFR